jgi:hypothetical protein
MENKTIPIPPIHWIKLRQNKRDFGMASISVKIEAPVVVSPETDSKKADEKSGIADENQKGNALKKETPIQPRVTIAIPSLAVIGLFVFCLKPNLNTMPIITEKNIEYKIASAAVSLKYRDHKSGKIWAIPTKKIKTPQTSNTNPHLIRKTPV